MEIKKIVLPKYLEVIFILLGIYVLLTMLYIAQGIILPIIFAIIIAIVLQPVVEFMMRLGVKRILAIIITLILAFLVIASFALFLGSQISKFGESWPKFVEKLSSLLQDGLAWVSGYFNIDQQSLDTMIDNSKKKLIGSSSAMIGKTLLTAGSFLVVVFLIPVYIFMILYYQPLLRDFINQLFSRSDRSNVSEVVGQIKTLIQRYLVGLVIEALIIGALYTATLLILGIEYAVMLGIIGAIINVIPYLGGIVGVALPMLIALATESNPWMPLYILIIFYIIQLIDNNYIVPKIVASQVKINALVSIIIVIMGNALWGIPGMFLSIPLVAILKVIFDRSQPLKPWGYLLGDDMPGSDKRKLKSNVDTK